jgi:hypothetical protein
LTVEIGPGTFGNIGLNCGGTWGNITFRGAGRKSTIIGTGSGAYSLNLLNCISMTFQDMTIGPMPGGFGGINWQGTGKSVWQNIDFFSAQTYGWQDVTWNCPTNTRGAHYWFNSRIVSTSNQGAARPYISRCAEDWFFGSEITANPGTSVGDAFVLRAISDRSEIHYYGGVLRLITGAGITGYGYDPTEFTGMAIALAEGGGEIHIHGTGIDILSTEGNPVIGLAANNGGEIHANGSAYFIKNGSTGSVTRLDNDSGSGHVHAPYLWEHVPSPATIPNFTSLSGADQTTVTVGTSDGHPHTAVYSSTCPANAGWYDTTDKVCRSQ